MATLLSPGVITTFTDNSLNATNAFGVNTAFCGHFTKGPVDRYVLITETNDFRRIFGEPTKENYNDWYQVYNYLQYSGGIYVCRAANIDGDSIKTQLTFSENAHKLNLIRDRFNAEFLDRRDNVLNFKTFEAEEGDVISISDSGSRTFDVISKVTIEREKANPDFVPLVDFSIKIKEDEDELAFTEGGVLNFEVVSDIENLVVEGTSSDNGIAEVFASNKKIILGTPGEVTLTFTGSAEGYRPAKITATFTVVEQGTTPLTVEIESEDDLKIGNTYNFTIYSTGAISITDVTGTLNIVEVSRDEGVSLSGTITPNTVGLSPLVVNAVQEGKKSNSVTKQLVINALPQIFGTLTVPTGIRVGNSDTIVLDIPGDVNVSVEVEDPSIASVNPETKIIETFKVGETRITITVSKEGYQDLILEDVIKVTPKQTASANITFEGVEND